jgi:hypothetical protein
MLSKRRQIRKNMIPLRYGPNQAKVIYNATEPSATVRRIEVLW